MPPVNPFFVKPVYRTMAMLSATVFLFFASSTQPSWAQSTKVWKWQALAPIPDELGLAGPVVGVHDDVLLVGGGANFERPVWENPKQWHTKLYLLDLRNPLSQWQSAGDLATPRGYSACASTPHGILFVGGNNEKGPMKDCWLCTFHRGEAGIGMHMERLSDLPKPLFNGQALWIKDRVVVLTGQTDDSLSSAIAGGWQLKLGAKARIPGAQWSTLPDCPGGPRALAMLSASSSQAEDSQLLLMGGRRQSGERVEFLSDVWQFDIYEQEWQRRADLPIAVAAGTAGPSGDRVMVLSGDDGRLFTQTEQLKDKHPGFAKRTWLFDGQANQWSAGDPSPANQVTTPAVVLADGRLIIASGEIRPRVRTRQVWQIR